MEREIGGDLTQLYDKNPYSTDNAKPSTIERIPKNIQGEKSRKDTANLIKTGLNNWSIRKSQKGGQHQVR